MVEARDVKVNFSITGDFVIQDAGDDYINFRNKSEMKKFDRNSSIKVIEKLIERYGIEHFDVNIATRSRDVIQTEYEYTPVEETIGDDEKPF